MRYLHTAVKNVTRQKRRSLLLAGAIAFGLMVILLVGGLADGIQDSFVNQQAGMISGHVVIKGFSYSSRDSLISWMDEQDPIVEHSRDYFGHETELLSRSTTFGTLLNGPEARQQLIMGIDPQEEETLREMLILHEGSFFHQGDQPGILISKDMAEDLRLNLGDSVMVKSRTLSGINNVADFHVQGIIADDLGTISSMASFVTRRDLNRLLSIDPEDFTELHLFLDDPSDNDQQATEFWHYLEERGVNLVDRPQEMNARQEVMSRLTSQDWQGIRYHLTSLEEAFQFIYVISGFLNGTALLVMLMLMGVILVGLTNTLRMMIFERRKEIGTMRALGMQRPMVTRTFLVEMMIISFIGILMGIALALWVGWIIGRINLDGGHTFISLFLYRGHLTMKFLPVKFLFSSLLILTMVWLASLRPASKAAKIDPAKAIHSIG